ncbi:MAG: hypothetical protein WAL97_05265 [Halobacteriota archaeon]
MDRKGITMSVFLATLVLVSLFAVVGSAASVSGTTMAGTGPAVSTWFYNGQSNIFAVDSNGTLWDTRITPSGGGIWNSLGGVSTSSPAAVSWGNTTRLDVFVRGADGALWHKYYQNGWSKWESLGGRLASGTGPAVSSSSSGKLDVFVQGTDGALWHTSYNNSWSKWESLGGKLTSSPAATAGSHASDVFARGTDGAVWWKYYQNGWSSWTSLGGQVAPNTGPAVSGNFIFPLIKLGTHRLFMQGTDHNLWLKSPTGSGWTAWGRIGMPPEALSTASPAAEINATGPTIIGITSTSGNVWYSVHNNDDNWNQWHSVGSPP